jgi:hypothetical protein
MRKPFGSEKEDAVAPWQSAQPLDVLGAFAWMAARLGCTEKLGFVWQALQDALMLYGMWLVGLEAAGRNAVMLWHWSHDAAVGMWPTGLPLARMPSWQLAQPPGLTPK